MKKEFYKSVGFKLSILTIIILLSLFTSAFMFNSQIDKMKKRIDYIYFGNYIPVLKLHTLDDLYEDLIVCMKKIKNVISLLF
ncbi:hypothetical protein [Halarcobacter anaerophilus]|uniref:hypothetical protein n=1 Tax=Halarcobacter anaerophilus TaxID=877500 RepID=UPI0012FF22A7|nr:hypothetical protein [Halarcobacter anaerophilus]